jgi:hypothetical protein
MSGDAIARALRLRRAGKRKWAGQCPSCGYKSGFTVTDRRDGLPLIFCHAGGCQQAELIAALGTLELWPNPPRITEHQQVPAAVRASLLSIRPPYPSLKQSAGI